MWHDTTIVRGAIRIIIPRRSAEPAMHELSPPTARGTRISWEDLPARLKAAIEAWLGEPVTMAKTQTGGMSPGLAARIETASGRQAFIKAVGPEPNVRSPEFYRREAEIAALLPASVPAPQLLWALDEGEGGWVVLALEDIDGRQPTLPWVPEELERVIACLIDLTTTLTPSPLSPEQAGSAESWGVVTGGWWARFAREDPALLDQLDEWTRRHLDALAVLEANASSAAAGATLLHLDTRDDNLLLTPERVVVLDWTHARVGAPWLDIVLFAPSVAMQGGPDPETLIHRHPAVRAADPDAITAVVAAIAGSLTYGSLQPPPPGLPALPAFMAAQGIEARRWLRGRTNWK